MEKSGSTLSKQPVGPVLSKRVVQTGKKGYIGVVNKVLDCTNEVVKFLAVYHYFVDDEYPDILQIKTPVFQLKV